MPLFTSLFPVAGVSMALQESNAAGKVIVALLFLGSIFVWSIMITKMRELSLAQARSRRFLKDYRLGDGPGSLAGESGLYGGSPLFAVYSQCIQHLNDLLSADDGEGAKQLNRASLASIQNMAERTVADQILWMEKSMGLLATATTTAPFLGLLGTVWGVMEAFGGMAVTGSAMLSSVAPGISGALLTTVVGLLVALPSAIGYNILGGQIRELSVRADNFAQELSSDMEQYYASGP